MAGWRKFCDGGGDTGDNVSEVKAGAIMAENNTIQKIVNIEVYKSVKGG